MPKDSTVFAAGASGAAEPGITMGIAATMARIARTRQQVNTLAFIGFLLISFNQSVWTQYATGWLQQRPYSM
jgi:hypothetical protein